VPIVTDTALFVIAFVVITRFVVFHYPLTEEFVYFRDQKSFLCLKTSRRITGRNLVERSSSFAVFFCANRARLHWETVIPAGRTTPTSAYFAIMEPGRLCWIN